MERLLVRQLARQWSQCSHSLGHHSTQQSLSARQNAISSRYLTGGPRQPARPKGFFERILDNIKTEWSENKEIKESVDKFKRETQKLEETEALIQAREKFKKVEADLKDVNQVLQDAKDSIKSGVEKAKEAEFVKKTMQMTDKISSTAKEAAGEISKQGEYLKETTAYKTISEASKTVEKEIDNADIISSLYKAPKELLTRSERSIQAGRSDMQRKVEPNEDVQSVELHKDSKWSQNWNKFKEDNPYVNKVFEFKMRYDESDNAVVRATRAFVDRVTYAFGGLFKTTDISDVLSEICKVDPEFDIHVFLKHCEKTIIPTILESISQGRLDILSDWCHEAVFNVLSQPQNEAKKLGLTIHSKIVDIQNIELAMGKMMDQGPVLVLTFQAQQLTYVLDSKGNVVEGNKDKITQNTYVMAFCRDQSDLDPYTAWRLIDVAMQESDFLF